MENFRKLVTRAAIIAVVFGIVWSSFSYNSRPLPFDDLAPQVHPIEEIAKNGADAVQDAAKGIDFDKFWETVENKAKEYTVAPEAPTVDSGVPTTVDLAAVKIGDPRLSGYDRDSFGSAWVDVDGNGCDTRNDILARDLTQIVRTDNCTIASGVLNDKYTGDTINFIRGKSKVDIDHVIPLSYSFKQGSGNWTTAQREAFANDPANLVAASASANRSKSDSGPSEWMPTNSEYRCEYGKKFAAVAVKYELPITQSDFNTIQSACN